MGEYSVIMFFSTNNSMWAAKVLKKAGITRKLIPIPRHLSSDCGYCLRILTPDRERIENLLQETGIEFNKIVEL